MELVVGACGIACFTCRFYVGGDCAGCWPGNSEVAKREVERRKSRGLPLCPALECAVSRGVPHCLSCPDLPCRTLEEAEYPFGRPFLSQYREPPGGEE